jgi:hypothetical protein
MIISWLRCPSGKLWAVAAVALTVTSCESRQPLSPVRGQVFFQGQPANGAVVILHPVGEDEPTTIRPHGVVGSDGTFQVSTYGENDGAPVGEYAVTFAWFIEDPRRKSDWSPLPVRYTLPEQSGFRITIAEGANDLSPFQLSR